MKRNVFFAMIGLAAALFLTACAEDSVLLLDGKTADQYCGEEGSGIQEVPDTEPGTAVSWIMVHICGMVMEPGVYELPEGSRVYEAVEKAGGFAAGAAESYLNLAETVADGQKLVVPSLDEVESDRYGLETAGEGSGLININTADKELLMTLPGIGESRALAIIAWRTEHGPFQTAEDIMQVSGIKEAAYEKIKLLITTE